MDENRAWMIVGVICLLLVQQHNSRRDQDFLIGLSSKRKSQMLFSFEYLMIVLPFTLVLFGLPLHAITLITFSSLLGFIPISKKGGNKFSIFGAGNYEWNSGLRMIMILAVAILIGFIASCIAQVNINVSLVLGAIFGLLITFFYGTHEDVSMMTVYLSPKQVLRQKIIALIRSILLWFLPIITIYTIAYGVLDYKWLFVISQVFLLATTSILLKYSHLPNKQAADLQLTILYLVGFIPFLIPVMILINLHYYKRAISHLNKFFPYAEN